MFERVPTPKNDPKLLRLVRVRVLHSFCVAGAALEIGAEATIEFHVARDMQALGKAELLSA